MIDQLPPQGTLGQAQPDDPKFAWRNAARRIIESLLARGWPVPARFASSIRAGSGTLTAADGLDGRITADGTAGGFTRTDRGGTGNAVSDFRSGTTWQVNTTELTGMWQVDCTTGYMTQASLTTLTAGTNITLGATGFATQGSRIVKPTGHIHAIINLTATGAIAVGATVATLASGHRPPGTIAIAALKLTGGVSTSPVTTFVFIASSGTVATEVALANTDVLLCTATFMTS